MMMPGNSALQDLFDRCGTAELVAPDGRHSAVALHHGANDWSRALRRAGITRGDRIVCALPNGAAFVQLAVAALADGITLVPVPAREDVAPLLDAVDARIAIATVASHEHVATPSRSGGPPGSPMIPRASRENTDTIAFLLRTSGTAGQPRWIALGERSVIAVLESHLPALAIDGSSTLCMLPWSHAFGLILGLLPGLLRARRIVVVSDVQRAPTALIDVARQLSVTHLSMVPMIATRLGETSDGRALLHALSGGLVGGAAIDAPLAAVLGTTRLRVGYGQTEASPGITLGEPGEFSANFLGRPVGCQVRIEDDGVLAFRGLNASAGVWHDGRLEAFPVDRWHRTEDLVASDGDAYRFIGRNAATFKLANGRLVLAPQLEAALRQHFPRITDVVLTTRSGESIDVMYSTRDAQQIGEQEIRGVLGGLGNFVRTMTPVRSDAWVRTPKGEIDRRRLPVASGV